jgi:hypothetical protein
MSGEILINTQNQVLLPNPRKGNLILFCFCTYYFGSSIGYYFGPRHWLYMVGIFERIFVALGFRRKQVHILLVGLENAGKSSLIQTFSAQTKGDELVSKFPSGGELFTRAP